MTKPRHKIIPAVYLLLIEDNKILMLKRANTGFEDGKYSLVAGHLEAGETLTNAMVREAKEEANIDLEEKDLTVVHIMHKYLYKEEYLDIFIIPKKWSGKIENLEPEKCDHLDWFHIKELPKNTIPYIRHAIYCFQNNILYSNYGDW